MTAPFQNPLTDRELRWLRYIAVHGSQSSQFLLELVADTHRCKDTGLRKLKELRDKEYLRWPSQQDQIAKADFNPKVYDLTRKSTLHLKGLGDPTTVSPTGHWWHAYLTASITSALAIECARRGYRYIPAHDILYRHGATLAIPIGRQKLIPDQLFAIDYGGRFRSFVLEVDRGTEPYRSEASRKSLRRMIGHYGDLNSKDALRRHYGLKSPLLILMAFTAPERAAKCLEILECGHMALAPTVLVGIVPPWFPRFEPLRRMVAGPWKRAHADALSLFI